MISKEEEFNREMRILNIFEKKFGYSNLPMDVQRAIHLTIQEYDKSIKEMIEKLDNDLQSVVLDWFYNKDREWVGIIAKGVVSETEISELKLEVSNKLKELLSKIGDNSNSENWDSGDTCVYEGDNSEVEK